MEMIKQFILKGYAVSDVTMTEVFLIMLLATVLALYIYFIYRITSRVAFYSRDFNKSLAVLPVIVAAVMLAMQSSLIIGLGGIGALTIVRYRAPVKEPMDLMFLFWAIGSGIMCGAGVYGVALICALLLTVLIFVLDLLPTFRAPQLLIINCSEADIEKPLNEILARYADKGARIKSRNITQHGVDIIVELRTRQEAQLVDACAKLPGLVSVNLMDHDGEIRC